MVLVVLLLTIFALVRELASPDLIMLSALAALMGLGAVTVEAGLSGFAEPAVLTIGSLFVFATVVQRTGALDRVLDGMRPRSNSIGPALARIMLPASAFSSVTNNTPLVALLVPQVERWCRRVGLAPSKLLLPLSYATILGGMSTLIGTSTNLVVSGLLAQSSVDGRGLGFFDLAWIGVPAALVGFLYMRFLGHRLLPEKADAAVLAEESLRSYHFELVVPAESELVGKSVGESGLRQLRDAFLGHIVRRATLVGPVAPGLCLESGDVLAFTGDADAMHELIERTDLERPLRSAEGTAETRHLPLFEAVVSANSSLQGSSLKKVNFRERFQAVVIGIHRAGRRLEGPLGRVALETGDLLLLEAQEGFARNWNGSSEFYMVAPLARPERRRSRGGPWVLALFVAFVVTVATGLLSVTVASFAAALLAVFIGRLSPHDARRALDLSVLLVLAAAFGIAAAMRETGLDAFLAAQLLEWTGAVAPVLGALGVLALIYLVTNLLTEILTNNVAAVMVFPIGLQMASQLHVEPRACAVVTAIAASASFATPIGYQTNLMVLGPGGYSFRDYLHVGLPLNAIIFLLTLALVYVFWL